MSAWTDQEVDLDPAPWGPAASAMALEATALAWVAVGEEDWQAQGERRGAGLNCIRGATVKA